MNHFGKTLKKRLFPFLTVLLVLVFLCACNKESKESSKEITGEISSAQSSKEGSQESSSTPDSGSTTDPASTPTSVPELTPTPTSTPTPTPTPLPKEPCVAAKLSVANKAMNSSLFDDNFMTTSKLSGGSNIDFSSDIPVKKLYIIWNDHPEACSLLTPGGDVTIGNKEFMHELVTLPEEVDCFTLVAPKNGTTLCDVYAFSDGILPSWVQDWEPPYETADILLFSTHSDDEFIFFGGIIPSYGAGIGLRVQVAYMTSPYIGSERYRCHELLNGLWTAGLKNYPVTTGYRDWGQKTVEAAKSYYGEDNFKSFEVEQIRRFKPLVVLGHDLKGEYGHTVHMLSALTLNDAVPAAADATKYKESAEKYGTWDTPKFYLHLYGKNPTILNYETPLDAFGGKTAYQVAKEAYAKHISQQKWSFTVYSFDSPLDSHRFGLVRSLVGEDVKKKDLMENISPEAFRN